MLTKIWIVLIVVMCISFSNVSHLSAEKYDVSVGIWGMFVTKSDNLWGNGNRTITSIYSKPDSSSVYLAFPYIDFKVIPERGVVGGKGATTFYINSALEPGSLSAGARQRFEKSFVDVYGGKVIYGNACGHYYCPYLRQYSAV